MFIFYMPRKLKYSIIFIYKKQDNYPLQLLSKVCKRCGVA